MAERETITEIAGDDSHADLARLCAESPAAMMMVGALLHLKETKGTSAFEGALAALEAEAVEHRRRAFRVLLGGLA